MPRNSATVDATGEIRPWTVRLLFSCTTGDTDRESLECLGVDAATTDDNVAANTAPSFEAIILELFLF